MNSTGNITNITKAADRHGLICVVHGACLIWSTTPSPKVPGVARTCSVWSTVYDVIHGKCCGTWCIYVIPWTTLYTMNHIKLYDVVMWSMVYNVVHGAWCGPWCVMWSMVYDVVHGVCHTIIHNGPHHTVYDVVHGAWCGPWCMSYHYTQWATSHCIWCGPWCMMWSMVYDVVHGVWCGPWCMMRSMVYDVVHGVWCGPWSGVFPSVVWSTNWIAM